MNESSIIGDKKRVSIGAYKLKNKKERVFVEK
jgi:hypothetical protein